MSSASLLQQTICSTGASCTISEGTPRRNCGEPESEMRHRCVPTRASGACLLVPADVEPSRALSGRLENAAAGPRKGLRPDRRNVGSRAPTLDVTVRTFSSSSVPTCDSLLTAHLARQQWRRRGLAWSQARSSARSDEHDCRRRAFGKEGAWEERRGDGPGRVWRVKIRAVTWAKAKCADSPQRARYWTCKRR